jgi:hypothetical protein
MSTRIQEQILRFEISINHIKRMQMFLINKRFKNVANRGKCLKCNRTKARQTSAEKTREISGEKRPSLRRWENTSPPCTNSITMYRALMSWYVDHKFTINGWVTLNKIPFSFTTCST